MLPSGGSYVYWRNGEAASVSEHFSFEAAREGCLTRSTRDAPSFDTRIEVLAWSDAPLSPRIHRFEVASWRAGARARATYSHKDGRIEVEREAAVGEVAWSLEASTETLLYPLMRVFLGPLILAVARRGDATVVLPSIQDPADAVAWLSPISELRTARLVAASETPLGDKGPRADHYQFLTSRYDAGSSFWIDASGQLVRYLFPEPSGALWDVRLEV